MADLNKNIVVKLTANVGDYVSDMNKAGKATEQLGKQGGQTNPKLAVLGKYATKAGLAVGALSLAMGAKAVSTFADFDEAMSDIRVNTGASAAEMDALGLAAREAGRTTVFGATDSANAILELAKAGMSTADVLNGGLSGALNLAASDGMQVADAAELMASTLAQFNLEGKDATAVADALAAGAAAAQGSASDLGQALSQSGMVANSFGISMQETVGTLSAFANAGMIGSDAGTSLKSMLQHLAAPSGKAAKTMSELGISAYDAAGNFVGLEGLAGQLKDRLGALSPEARNAAMSVIFGSDAVRAANVLYEQGTEGIAQWTKTVSQSGIAAEMAAGKTDNLKGDLEQLGGAVEEMLLSVGQGVNGSLRGLVQWATDVADAFASLPAEVQQGVVAFGLLTGAGAGLHKMFGGLKDSTSAFGRTMGLVLDPVQRIKAAAPMMQEGFAQLSTALKNTGLAADGMLSGMSRGQTALAGLKSVGSGVASLFGGPWGIALTLAGVALNAYAQETAKAKQQTEELTSAIKNSADVNETIVKQLNETEWTSWKDGASNITDALDMAGISMSEFIQAAKEGGDAADQMKQRISALSDTKGLRGLNPFDTGNNAAQKLFSEFDKLTTKYAQAEEAAANQKQTLDELSASEQENAAAAGEAAAATEELADASEILESVFGAAKDAVDAEASALLACVEAMDKYYGYSTSMWDTETALHDAFDKAAESIKKNGKTLDINTEKGRANRNALSDLVEATRKHAEAQAANGEAAEKVSETMNLGRKKIEEYGRQMGMSEQDIQKFIQDNGLAQGAVEDVISKVDALNKSKGVAKVEADTADADGKLDTTKLKVTSLPNGKVMVYGDNVRAMESIAEVVGATIDPKTGTITADKTQYDQMLALANGAKIDPKTGELLADPKDFNQKFLEVQGWKIDPKTGKILGDNGNALAKIAEVNNKKIPDKYFKVSDGGTIAQAEQAIGRLQQLQIGDKTYTVKTYYTSEGEKVHGGTIPKANGGYVSGPGTGTSDSIPAMLSNGEFVIRASQTAKHRKLLEAINAGRYPAYATGGLVAAAPVRQYIEQAEARPAIQYVQNVTNRMYSTGNPRVQAELTAAKMRMATRKLVSR